MVSWPLSCGSWWCPTFKVILNVMDVYLPRALRPQSVEQVEKEDQSYKWHFPSGVYAICSQVHMPRFNFSEHHTYITNWLLAISM